MERVPAGSAFAFEMIFDVYKPDDYQQLRELFSAMHLLEQVGLADKAKAYPSQLSGGERLRVAVLRALINDPSIIFADEPTGNLDSRTAGDVFDLFNQLVDEGKTMLMVTHDKELAKRVPRVVEITDGKITRDEFIGGANWMGY